VSIPFLWQRFCISCLDNLSYW